MVGKSYLPAKDSDLQFWATNFIKVATDNLATLGLVAADLTNVSADKSNLDASISNNKTKMAEAKAATENKRNVRKKFEADARIVVRKIQANPAVPSDLKAKLGITVKDSHPSPLNPISPKDAMVNPNVNGINKITWDRNTNPQGTIFIIEAQEKPGDPWLQIGTTSKSYFEHLYQLPGKTKYYRVRAQRNDTTSEPSNETVVYPSGTVA